MAKWYTSPGKEVMMDVSKISYVAKVFIEMNYDYLIYTVIDGLLIKDNFGDNDIKRDKEYNKIIKLIKEA